MERLKKDLANSFREKGVSGVNVERVEGTELHITVPSANAERLRGILKAILPIWWKRSRHRPAASGSEFFLTLSREEMRSLRDYTVDQSLETIRNRIDQFGVSEPIIQRKARQHPGPASRHPRPAARQGDHRQNRAVGVQAGR